MANTITKLTNPHVFFDATALPIPGITPFSVKTLSSSPAVEARIPPTVTTESVYPTR